MKDNKIWYSQKIEELVKDKGEIDTRVYERPAKEWLVSELRKLADHIESENYPRVMDASIPKEGVNAKETILEFNVQLSHPWGG